MTDLLQQTSKGLYCPIGDFFVDPHLPVQRAVLTHAHSDHARPGSAEYLAASPSEHLLRMRLSSDAAMQFLPYGESISVGGVSIRFYPAGHILGSAQVRLEHQGQVAVVMGEKKEDLQNLIETAFRNGEKPQMDYRYYPLKWVEPYKTRRFQ